MTDHPAFRDGIAVTAGASRPENDVKHLNQVQLARRWCLSPRTLERWRWKKQGPPYLRIGGRIAYRISDIVEFELAQRHLPVSPLDTDGADR